MKLALLIFFIFLSAFLAHADEPSKVILHTPSGRYLEDNPPNLFRWTLTNSNTTSVALKVFRRDLNATAEQDVTLVSRFDLPFELNYLNWNLAPLIPGNYTWSIEGFNESQASALYKEVGEFTVEDTTFIDLGTRKIGILAGFSRGTYASSDPFYNVDFKTTPTVYGFIYQDKSPNRIWETTLQISDFTLRGSVKQDFALSGSYSYLLDQISSKSLDIFAGPMISILNFPRTLTQDGINLSTTAVTQVSPGGIFTIQKRVQPKLTYYSHVKLILPVFATEKLSSLTASQLNYQLAGGVIFTQLWPISIGIEIQYGSLKSATMNGNNPTFVTAEGWTFLPQLSYTF